MLSVEDWAEIRRLRRAERMPIKAIARVMGVSKNTVKRALAADGPPRYQRPAHSSIVDGIEPRIRELLQAWPTMPATVIAERIGWTRGLTVLKDRVRELRPVYLPPDPASRTSYVAGEIGQGDLWFPDITVPVGFGQTRTATKLPVLVMVTGSARWLSAWLLPSRAGQDLFAGWWRLLEALGAVPRVLVWDGEGAVGQRRGHATVLTEQAHAFRGTLGAKIVRCNPADPEAKGLVERANGYLETSFLPGRRFASPADFNAQLADWLGLANQRSRRALGCAPADRIGTDRAAMLPLPPVAPATGWQAGLRLPRDHYVRLDSNDYSVHPAAVGRRVEVRADLERVRVRCDGRLVADHERYWARHQTISDPTHLAAAARLRHDHAVAGRPAGRPHDQAQVELRCLADYDAAFGLTDAPGGEVACWAPRPRRETMPGRPRPHLGAARCAGRCSSRPAGRSGAPARAASVRFAAATAARWWRCRPGPDAGTTPSTSVRAAAPGSSATNAAWTAAPSAGPPGWVGRAHTATSQSPSTSSAWTVAGPGERARPGGPRPHRRARLCHPGVEGTNVA